MVGKIKGTTRYVIIDTGEVFDKIKQRYLTKSQGANGYLYVHLVIDDKPKMVTIHRLVGIAFVPGYKYGLDINHKDGNKKNNNWTNIEWATRSENIRHAYKMNLRKSSKGIKKPGNAKPIYAIDKAGNKYLFNTQSEAAIAFGISRGNIPKVLSGERTFAGGCMWFYQGGDK